MEVDQIPRVISNFYRRRPTEDSIATKRRSVEPPGSPILGLQRSHSPSISPKILPSSPIEPPVKMRAEDMDVAINTQESQFLCNICQRQFVEPRVLPCLHTFCTACLLGADCQDRDTDGDSSKISDSRSGSGSAGSGYESEQRDTSGSDGSWTPKSKAKNLSVKSQNSRVRIAKSAVSVLICPTCGSQNKLPAGGVMLLPPNYVLQNRMLSTIKNTDLTDGKEFCDLCSTDVIACTRCTVCLLDLCIFCSEAHKRQRITSHHKIIELTSSIDCSIADPSNLMRIMKRGPPMCSQHPTNELTLFCKTCCQVACRDCCMFIHRGHQCEPAAKAAQSYTRSVREALEKARPVAAQANNSLSRIKSLNGRVTSRCNMVQSEVDRFIEEYKKAVEDHRQTLQAQVRKARETKLQQLCAQEKELERRAHDTVHAVHFAEELLAEGSDIEVLSFVSTLLGRLQECTEAAGSLEPKVAENLQFLPQEHADVGALKLYGVITTQTVAPQHCVLDAEGLLNLRVHRKSEALLTAYDIDERPMCHGGERFTAELRYKDASNRAIPVKVLDCRDGTYMITFVPDASGKLILNINVRGKPIKASPFSVCARTLRPHHGVWHCCTFCSSSGKKSVRCACGGTMPGYQGCGHGHEGHPGRRHWSCCGNLLENSECTRTNMKIYQF